jgi:hypothetical protein
VATLALFPANPTLFLRSYWIVAGCQYMLPIHAEKSQFDSFQKKDEGTARGAKGAALSFARDFAC